MVFDKNWLESWYEKSDPWSYRSEGDDAYRKHFICNIIKVYSPSKVLDIGCGEGFITEAIEAKELHGLEISDKAASRLASHIKRILVPEGPYDLVLTAGTLYKEYDHSQISSWIKDANANIVVVAGIKDWLLPYSFGKVVEQYEFDYRGHLRQQVTVYETST